MYPVRAVFTRAFSYSSRKYYTPLELPVHWDDFPRWRLFFLLPSHYSVLLSLCQLRATSVLMFWKVVRMVHN